MRVLVTGSSGLIGTAVVADLERRGDAVIRLVRRAPPGPGEAVWDPERGAIDRDALAGLDAVVHLAGENLAAGRWTAERKRRIWQSRVDGTRLLCDALASLEHPPAVLVSASAIGYYGDRGDEMLTEASTKGSGFLADLVEAWEAATASVEDRGVRVVHLRNALVLSPNAGALGRLLPIFRLGLGGPIGGGRSWWSWITIDDLVAIVRFAIEREELRGPINAATPAPVTNAEFTRTLGRVLRRPAWLPVPAFLLELAFGEMAHEALLMSNRVEPARLRLANFAFRHPDLEAALRGLVAAGPRHSGPRHSLTPRARAD